MTTKKKADILAINPTCHLCHEGFAEGELIEFDHVIALALGGDDTIDNMRGAHVGCHKLKTLNDKRAIAKAKRLEAKRKGMGGSGGRRIPSRPFAKRPKGPGEKNR